MRPSSFAYNRHGFTLVELAIVLVIIGLIVGGVLVGQDMIKAAEVRATVGQYEKYNAAINTFRTKYNGMPGDLNTATASRFGLAARSGAAGHGDGNGLLEGCGAGQSYLGGCESLLFWRDLSFANLIDGSFTSAGDDYANPTGPTALAATDIPQYLPRAKLGRGNYFAVYSENGLNYYALAGIRGIDAAGNYDTSTQLTPSEAYNIDIKIDDGKPLSGIVTTSMLGELFVTPSPCQASATQYETTSSDAANTPACWLGMRFN